MSPQVKHPASPAPRVLVIGATRSQDSLEWHVLESLRNLGCAADLFDTRIVPANAPRLIRLASHKLAGALLREPERLFETRLLRFVQQFEPTLILVLLGNQLSPKTVRRLRAVNKATIVCWCQDSMITIGRQYLLGCEYDAVFVKDRYLQDLFSRMIRATPFFYLPEACNPRVHRPFQLTGEDRRTYECDIMIAGTLYYYRQEILRQLSEFDIKIWGLRPDWLLYRLPQPYIGKAVFADDKARAVAGAKICLNNLHYGEVNALNCRAFELAGCGGFQLITDVPVLSEHFEVGSELVSFTSTSQLVELIRHYLDHPDLAARIARQGQLRAHREHTFENRMTAILKVALGYDAVAA